MKLLAATLDAMVVPPPFPTSEEVQRLCLDKGYDNPMGHWTVEDYGYTGHVRRISEEKLDEAGQRMLQARRWIVERTFAWLWKFRSVLVRYERKADNQMACWGREGCGRIRAVTSAVSAHDADGA